MASSAELIRMGDELRRVFISAMAEDEFGEVLLEWPEYAAFESVVGSVLTPVDDCLSLDRFLTTGFVPEGLMREGDSSPSTETLAGNRSAPGFQWKFQTKNAHIAHIAHRGVESSASFSREEGVPTQAVEEEGEADASGIEPLEFAEWADVGEPASFTADTDPSPPQQRQHPDRVRGLQDLAQAIRAMSYSEAVPLSQAADVSRLDANAYRESPSLRKQAPPRYMEQASSLHRGKMLFDESKPSPGFEDELSLGRARRYTVKQFEQARSLEGPVEADVPGWTDRNIEPSATDSHIPPSARWQRPGPVGNQSGLSHASHVDAEVTAVTEPPDLDLIFESLSDEIERSYRRFYGA